MSVPEQVASPIGVTVLEFDTLGNLGAALAQHFGPGLEAVVVVRRRDNGARAPFPAPDAVVRPVAERVCDLLGVPKGLYGRDYLVDALVALAVAYPKRPHLIKEVCPIIALRRGVPAAGVHNGLRRAIRAAIDRHPEHAAATLGPVLSKPTPWAVLLRLLDLVAADLGANAAPVEGWRH